MINLPEKVKEKLAHRAQEKNYQEFIKPFDDLIKSAEKAIEFELKNINRAIELKNIMSKVDKTETKH